MRGKLILAFCGILTWFMLLQASEAEAQKKLCKLNDRSYPHGTVIGSLECINGRWVRTR